MDGAAAGGRGYALTLAAARHRLSANTLLVAIFVQLYLGALVAGLRAGRVYNTWPQIDGALIPDARASVLRAALVAQSVREHADGAVQSPHDRLCAVCAGAVASRRCHRAREADTALVNGALGIVIALTVQIALGVLTLLHMVPISLALMHQAVALIVLTQAIAQAWRLSGVAEGAMQPGPAR